MAAGPDALKGALLERYGHTCAEEAASGWPTNRPRLAAALVRVSLSKDAAAEVKQAAQEVS